jgi:tRNA-uridine 2-sulfurtransferase
MPDQITAKRKVFVGLSGGVDSATSAALLKRDGFDVTGVFIKVWQPDWIECTWREDRRDAMRVAAHLGIPFITLDLEREYKKEVIDYMIAEYAAGRTPNPDVMCNQHVKFGAFYDWAMEQGAEYVATGHYAITNADTNDTNADTNDTNGRIVTNNTNVATYELLAGTDPNKDQSYFLWTIKKGQLEHILFPVGHLLKSEVRRLAEEFKLPNATKKDSQGLCFIGKVDIKEFLSHYVKTEKGIVLNTERKVIGVHPGALFFTIGERHGFTITEKTPTDAPYYVVNKDVEKNTITVSDKRENNSLPGAQTKVAISEVNWIGSIPPIGSKLQARSRYRQPLQSIEVVSAGDVSASLVFEQPQDTLTPGQSLVIYEGDVCRGGGVIN